MTSPAIPSPESLIDRKVVDAAGRKVGSVGQVYLDDETGQPDWLSINTGLFGMTENFVPVTGAELTGKRVRLPYPRTVVKESPVIDDASHLDPDEERELYSYYEPHLVRPAG